MKKTIQKSMKPLLFILMIGCTISLSAQQQTLNQQVAQTMMFLWKDSMTESGKPAKWAYEQGVVLQGIESVWRYTKEKKYLDYIQHCMDVFVEEDGTIKTYKQADYNIDNVLCGRSLLLLYKETGKQKYKLAADQLRHQLKNHPRTNEGGFWHKKRYPFQMWLDGLYMGEPFYAQYAAMFNESSDYNDIANQFIWMEAHARDAKTGLLYHGWDESKKERWSNATTGCSSNFWARGMGWYGMGLVDVLPYFPDSCKKKAALLHILQRYADAIAKYQDAKEGLWFDVVNLPNEKPNYLETSASSMFIYTIAKAVRLGYLPKKYASIAQKAYEGMVKGYVDIDNDGKVSLRNMVKVSGLGGEPYRDGSFTYYMSEPVVTNDAKGLGAFTMAATEMEWLPNTKKDKANKPKATKTTVRLFVPIEKAEKLVADNMLLYQRSYGGWPKHIGNEKIDYNKVLSEGDKAALVDDASLNDATIDNNATNKEIRYLLAAYQKFHNPEYVKAVEKGIAYLLKMQHANGGFPQFYPDTSLYRSQITYNDDAMINTMHVLYDVAHKLNGFELINPSFQLPAQTAVEKGIECILKTQVKVNGQPTVWCAQYDYRTMQPAKARSFELISLSGAESVGIVLFLMRLPNPTPEIITSIHSAVQWFERSAIKGIKCVKVNAPNLPKAMDYVVLPDPNGKLWARFYEIETNRPFFCGRDSQKKYALSEIEHERRIGYRWYGTWCQELLDKDYPVWKSKNNIQ